MEGKTILLFITATCCLLQFATARKWPKCKNQTDLVQQYASIFEKNVQNSVVKREMSWAVNCFHAAIIKDENNDGLFSSQIFECCGDCEFPDFSLCALADNAEWECGSEAYDCVFTCRDEDSVLEAVIDASSLNLDRKRELSENITETQVKKARKELRRLRKERKCYKRSCTVTNGERDCCLINTCVSINDLVAELGKKKKAHKKYFKKLAKAKSASKTTSSTK